MSLLSVAGWVVAWFAITAIFVALFRLRQGVVVIAIVLLVVVLEVVFFTSQNDVEGGVLNPAVAGGVSFSIFDVLALAAVVAVLLARRAIVRPWPILAWIAVSFWIGVTAVIGLASGYDPELVGFSARSGVYLLLLIPVASVGAVDYVSGRVPLAVVSIASLLSILVLIASGGVSLPGLAPDPELAGSPWGAVLGGDAATILFGIGAITFVRAAVEERGRLRGALIVISTPLLVTIFASTQRAALMGAGVAVGLVALAWLSPRWRRQIRFRAVEGWALCAAAVASVATLVVAGTIAGSSIIQAPVDAFTAEGKSATLTSRWDQWQEAGQLALERPIFGHGSGFEYTVILPSIDQIRTTTLTHNVPLDLFLRGGVFALALALIAVILAYRVGVAAWRHALDSRVSALALAGTAALSSLLVKGLVESVLEKYRLMTFMGVILGLIIAASLAGREQAAGGATVTEPSADATAGADAGLGLPVGTELEG